MNSYCIKNELNASLIVSCATPTTSSMHLDSPATIHTGEKHPECMHA
jgi:hypothetical protein